MKEEEEEGGGEDEGLPCPTLDRSDEIRTLSKIDQACRYLCRCQGETGRQVRQVRHR